MKKLFVAFLLVAMTPLLQADNIMKNGDFTDGANYWHGDGKTPAEMKPQDSLDNSPDYGGKGLIVPLKPHQWTKVYQEYKSKSTHFSLKVTYKLYAGTSFSSADSDYLNLTHSIGFDGWSPINGQRGNWVAMISDIADYDLYERYVTPNFGSTAEQTYSFENSGSLPPDDEKTVCLAFPPGTGAIIILSITLEPR